MSFCPIASHIPIACINSLEKSSTGDPSQLETDGPTRSALAPRPIAQKKPWEKRPLVCQWNPPENKFRQADAEFFRLLNQIAGTEPGSIVVLPEDYNFHGLKYAMKYTKPGGFLLLDIGEWLGFKLHLQIEGWEQLPMLWGKSQIWRKPNRMNGASA